MDGKIVSISRTKYRLDDTDGKYTALVYIEGIGMVAQEITEEMLLQLVNQLVVVMGQNNIPFNITIKT